MTGNADGGRGGAAVDTVRKPDYIGFGIIVVGQIAADTVNPDAPDTIGREYPLGSFCTSKPTGRILL